MSEINQEMKALGEMLHAIMHPEERNFALADVAEQFSGLPNAEELIKGFARKPYSRDDFVGGSTVLNGYTIFSPIR